jgi:cysteine-rich repeat protein
MMKALAMPVLLCGLIAAVQPAMAATNPNAVFFKCASSKLKAASKKEAGLFNCSSKNAAKPDPTALMACQTKVTGKFDPAFTKADLKGACVGRSVDVEGTVDLCIDNASALVPPVADTCNTGTGFCTVATTTPCKSDADCELVKCTSAKLKALGKAAGGQLNCWSKAAGKPGICNTSTHLCPDGTTACTTDADCVSVDPACTQKATDGLTTAFGKADAKGACPGDPAAVNVEVNNGCVQPVVGELPGKKPGCGNGIIEGFPPFNETCDDGNTADGDGCPSSCHVDSCTPVTPSSFGAHVTYTGPAGTTISGLGYFVDYPEGKVRNPTVTPAFGVSSSVNDLGYGFTANALKLGGLPSPLVTLSFQTCLGAAAATQGEFSCKVTDASDDLGNVVDPTTVTCTVTVP